MTKKKINILVILLLVFISFFMSVFIVKINSTFASQDALMVNNISEANKTRDEEIKNLIDTENAINSQQNAESGVKIFNTFLEVYENALSFHNDAEFLHAEATGTLDCTANTASDTPIIGKQSFNLQNTMYYSQTRSRSGEELFIYGQYGEVPDLIKSLYKNSAYCLQYKNEDGSTYAVETGKEEKDLYTGEHKKVYSKALFLDTFKNGATDIFYDINKNTVKNVSYFSIPSNSKGIYEAKVIIDKDNSTKKYASQIKEMLNFYKPAKFQNDIEIEFKFTFDGKFISMSVNESFDVAYDFSGYIQPINVEYQYKTSFNYKKARTIEYKA